MGRSENGNGSAGGGKREDLLRGFGAETRDKTLATGRAAAAVAVVLIPLFWIQDAFVAELPWLWPWRVVGFAPFALFLALSFGFLQRHRSLVIPAYGFSLAAIMVSMCGIFATIALRTAPVEADLHGAAAGISACLFAVFVFASGARRFLPVVALAPPAAMAAAILVFGRFSAKEWIILSNPAVEALFVAIYSAIQERMRLREFEARRRSSESDRLLRVQRDMMSALLEAINESAFLMKPDGTVVYANSTIARRMGIGLGDLIGGNAYGFLPPDVAAYRKGRISEAIERAAPVRFTDERQGRFVDNSVYPLLGAGGAVEYLAIFGIDMTDKVEAQRRAEGLLRDKTVLLKEVHHRIKNNMAMIASLLSIETERTRDPVAVDALSGAMGRVQTMGRIYESLFCSGEYSTIELARYLGGLLGDIGAAYVRDDAVTLDYGIDDASVAPNLAFGIGILINELVTNALKYAFPGGKGGTVRVRVGLDGKDTLRLVVSDDGIGRPDLPRAERKGFGLQLVDMMVEQYGGSQSVDTNGGTVYTITFPVPGMDP